MRRPIAHDNSTRSPYDRLAHALDARVVLVADGDAAEDPQRLAEQLDMQAQAFDAASPRRLLGAILMRLPPLEAEEDGPIAPAAADPARPLLEAWRRRLVPHGVEEVPLIGAVPYHAALGAPRTLDVAHALQARFLHTGEAAPPPAIAGCRRYSSCGCRTRWWSTATAR